MLDPRSEDYDKDLIERVQELRYGLQQSGRYTPTQALIQALSYVLPADTVSEPTEPPVEAGNKRQEQALKKAVDSAKKQPASAKDVGLDSDKAGMKGDIDPSKLTVEDLENLPMETLRRLRGDFA